MKFQRGGSPIQGSGHKNLNGAMTMFFELEPDLDLVLPDPAGSGKNWIKIWIYPYGSNCPGGILCTNLSFFLSKFGQSVLEDSGVNRFRELIVQYFFLFFVC